MDCAWDVACWMLHLSSNVIGLVETVKRPETGVQSLRVRGCCRRGFGGGIWIRARCAAAKEAMDQPQRDNGKLSGVALEHGFKVHIVGDILTQGPEGIWSEETDACYVHGIYLHARQNDRCTGSKTTGAND